jgi:hypothetical protein
MSSCGLELGDVVLPGGSVVEHGAVDDVDQVAFEDASSAADSLRGRVAGQQFSSAGVESLLNDGRRVEHAVEPSVAAAVQAVVRLYGADEPGPHRPGPQALDDALEGAAERLPDRLRRPTDPDQQLNPINQDQPSVLQTPGDWR